MHHFNLFAAARYLLQHCSCVRYNMFRSNTLMHRNPSDKWHRARSLQMNFHARLATNLLWYSCTGAWLSTPLVAVKCQRRELKTGMSAHSPQTVQYLSDVSLAVHMTHCAKSTTGCTRLKFTGCETLWILCNVFVKTALHLSHMKISLIV
jgi:hypothetical protein